MPLGLALLAALAMLWRERRQGQRFKKQIDALTSEKSTSQSRTSEWENSERKAAMGPQRQQTRHQLEDREVDELQGVPLQELDGR